MIQEATESLIKALQKDVHKDAVLVFADDVFEVKRVSSVILQGPSLSEHGRRRCIAPSFSNNTRTMTTEKSRHPRYYHLDFELIVTTGTEVDMLQTQEKVAGFLDSNPVIQIGPWGQLNLVESVPLGSHRRVNLSNLHQCSAKLRLEDCPVYSGEVVVGKLISSMTIQFTGDVNSELNLKP